MKYNGTPEDKRSKALKDKDYDDREIDFGAVQYLTKKQADKSKGIYPDRNQKNSSACVSFAIITALYETEHEVLSPAYPYTQRKNKPEKGSYYDDIASICVAQGVCKESTLPTPATEKKLNEVIISKEAREEAKKFQQKAFVWVNEVKSIDSIVNKLNSGIPVVISIFADGKEWNDEYPVVKNKDLKPQDAWVRHAVLALPYSGHTYKGKKYFIIQDSAKFGGRTFRYVSEDWCNLRVRNGLYFIDLKIEEFSDRLPFKYTWTRNLTVGDTGEDVLRLQQALQWLGYFPQGTNPTGYFGGISRQAVKDYQEANRNWILKPLGLDKPTGVFGEKTRTLLNKLQ